MGNGWGGPRLGSGRVKRGITNYIYIAFDDVTACKIGVACNVGKRLAQLQAGNRRPLHAYTIKIDAGIDAGEVERAIHRKLRDRDKHINGEWFRVGPKYARVTVEAVAFECGLPAERSEVRPRSKPLREQRERRYEEAERRLFIKQRLHRASGRGGSRPGAGRRRGSASVGYSPKRLSCHSAQFTI
jgi:hypothetical protein